MFDYKRIALGILTVSKPSITKKKKRERERERDFTAPALKISSFRF
jgi:purine-nucleoside phosphorylase